MWREHPLGFAVNFDTKMDRLDNQCTMVWMNTRPMLDARSHYVLVHHSSRTRIDRYMIILYDRQVLAHTRAFKKGSEHLHNSTFKGMFFTPKIFGDFHHQRCWEKRCYGGCMFPLMSLDGNGPLNMG